MIEWSKGAEEQLFEILFSFKATATLERFQKQLDEVLKQLETFPESARMNPAPSTLPPGFSFAFGW